MISEIYDIIAESKENQTIVFLVFSGILLVIFMLLSYFWSGFQVGIGIIMGIMLIAVGDLKRGANVINTIKYGSPDRKEGLRGSIEIISSFVIQILGVIIIILTIYYGIIIHFL